MLGLVQGGLALGQVQGGLALGLVQGGLAQGMRDTRMLQVRVKQRNAGECET